MRLIFCGLNAAFDKVLITQLERESYGVDSASDSRELTRLAATGKHQVLMVDIGAGHPGQVELLQKASSLCPDLHAMVFAETSTADLRIHLFDAGADEVMDKPLELDEVVARLRRLRKRSWAQHTQPKVRVGPVRLDVGTRDAYWNDRPVTLSNMEFRLLLLLLQSPGHVVCRNELEQSLYGGERGVASNAVEVHIYNLRRKLSRDAIEAVRGIGYRLAPAICDA